MERTKRFTVTGFRLVALWAFAEAGLGGVLHALHLPLTGLLVGGFAVLCMALLARYEKPDAILPALGVVLAVKFLASPHSPPPAYLAVTFQGVVAWTLFRFVPNFRVAAALLGMLSLAESASQKLIMLLLFFGKPIYEASATFMNSVAESLSLPASADGSDIIIWLVAGYLTFHVIVGLGIGLLAGKLPDILRSHRVISLPDKEGKEIEGKKKGIGKWLPKAMLLMVPVLIIYFYYDTSRDYPLLRILLRLFFVYLLTGPVLQVFLGYFLRNRANRYSLEVSGVLEALPKLRRLMFACWKEARTERGWKRLRTFGLLFMASWLFKPPGQAQSARVSRQTSSL